MKQHFTKQDILCVILCVVVLFLSVTSIYMYKELSSYKKMFNIMVKKLDDYRSEDNGSGKVAKNNTKSNSNTSTYKDITQSDDDSEDGVCQVPNCNFDAAYGSLYCTVHECLAVGCHNRRANDFCNYCTEHKCHISDCNRGAAHDSNYCTTHK